MSVDEALDQKFNKLLNTLEERLSTFLKRPQPWLLEKDVMAILHIDSPKTIRNYREQMQAKQIGGKWQYDPENVEFFRKNYPFSTEGEESVGSKSSDQKPKIRRRKHLIRPKVGITNHT